MAGGILRALYSGTRGLDLSPTKLRLDERYRNQQLAEDMRRALAGEKIQESELALRQSALAQQKDTEGQRMALERELAGQRNLLEKDKLGLDRQALAGFLDNGQPTIDRFKTMTAATTDIPPWQKSIALWQAIAGAKKAGINLRLNDKGELELAPEQPKEAKASGAPIDATPEKSIGQKIGESIWEFNKWYQEKMKGTKGDPNWEPPKDFKDMDAKTRDLKLDFLKEKAAEAKQATDAQLMRLVDVAEAQNDNELMGILEEEGLRRELFDIRTGMWKSGKKGRFAGR